MRGKISLSLKFDCFPLASDLKTFKPISPCVKREYVWYWTKWQNARNLNDTLFYSDKETSVHLGNWDIKENLAVRHINIQLTYLHMHTHTHEKSSFCVVKTLSIASFVHTHIVQTHRYTQINSYAALVIQDILYPVSKEEQIK